ncbi:fungal-specific transcription factor domain-containing protein [Aspergillus carlsbadensis]|nr:fungal-specific transcription factor domain-containing protein [Aspergillus carlsbadensis]
MTSEPTVESGSIPMRSFGGCDTCRRRHVKCDETRPWCLLCRNAGVPCSGYATPIIFDRGATDAAGTSRFRRTISTERERQVMSQSLTEMMPPRLALRQLAELDEECERVPTAHEVQARRGPFGAFRLGRTHSPSPVASPPSHCLPTLSPPDSLQLVDPPSLEMVQAPYPSNAPIDITEIDWTFDPIPGPSQPRFSPRVCFSDRPQPRSPLASPVSAIPPNTTVLLQHYSTRVLDLLTPFRHTKTPWHVMFVPQAKRCVAALALGETVDHATLCTFYAILAISALSLGGISQAPVWIQEANIYEQSARQECVSMLKSAYNIPKPAKHKYILMALISMIQVSLCLSRWTDADYYFLEAEKFIRLRGLKRTKSRKVRLLHHCYVFWRMLHESTYIGGRPSGHRRRVLQAIQSSELAIYSRGSLSFRLPKWTDLETEMKQVKAQDIGENDLHNEHPGAWPSTLYPEVFGIHEPWLFLLSLIIRLGKEKDAAEQRGNTSDALPLADFLARAKTIENVIFHLHRQQETEHIPAPHDMHHDDRHPIHTLAYLVDAALHAIQIFFYRRIYDLDGSLLQQKVQCVLDCLSRGLSVGPSTDTTEEQGNGTGHGLAGFVWPAFIAACEAKGPGMQAAYASWFQRFASVSGLPVFQNVGRIVVQIWKEKARAAGRRMTWTELMKRSQQLSIEITV